MKRHEADRAARIVDIVGRCHERHLGEKVDEGALGVVLVELFRDGQEFFDVFGTRLILRITRGTQSDHVARALEDHREQLAHFACHGHRFGLGEEGIQLSNRSRDLGAKAESVGKLERLTQGDAVLVRERL